jgi:hypothetical protein
MSSDLPRVMARADARARGISDRAIHHHVIRRRWRQLHPGVYFTRGAEPRYADELAGAVLASGSEAVVSGAAALVLWDIKDVQRPRRPLIIVPMTNAAAATQRLAVRRTPTPIRFAVRDGVRVADLARALTDHCVEVSRLATVQAIASEVIRRKLCTVAELDAAYQAGPRRGSANLRIALEDVAFGAWSVPEAIVGRALRAACVPAFTQNSEVRTNSGKLLAVADVWWPELRAVLEIHGAEHHQAAQAWSATLRRAARLEAAGIAVLQIPAVDIMRDLHSALRDVVAWLGHLALRKA